MKRLLLALVVVLVSVVTLSSVAVAQSTPQFKLGFKALADQLPADVVGTTTENEYFNLSNGNSEQHTTKGLMVWRKADNWTAFTDGAWTWINGPGGVQSRPNSERFSWESAPPGAGAPAPVSTPAVPTASQTSCFLPSSAVTFGLSQTRDGAWQGDGTIRNTCTRPMNAEISIAAYGSRTSPPIMDAPSVFVGNLPAGQSRPFSVRVPPIQNVGTFLWSVTSGETDDDEYGTADVGAVTLLQFSPHLAGTIFRLKEIEGGEWLLKVTAENGVKIKSETTDIGILGTYNPKTKTVTLDARLEAYSAWVRTAVLAHELQHAADHAAGKWPTTTAQCYRFEEDAFRREAGVWSGFWQSVLPPNVDSVHAELNDIATTVSRDPVRFALDLLTRYQDECGN